MGTSRHLALAALGLAASAAAQPSASVPPVIKARVNELVARCAAAGGTLGDMTGQGKFVIPADFTGDGRTDFVVSEGNFPCAGRPNLFRPDGLALVELHVADGRGSTSLAFSERLLAYRIVAGPPARLQIARRGAACGASNARCGDELRWNAAVRGFDLMPTDGRQPVATTSAPATTTQRPGPAPASFSVLPDARDRFIAQCRKDMTARYPAAKPAGLAATCSENWVKAVAAGPIADAILAAVPASPGDQVRLADLRTRLPQIRWQATGKAHRTSGSMDKLEVAVTGNPVASSIGFSWREVDADPPYDAAAALAARGAKVTALGCYHFGVSEVTRIHRIEAPGRAPFALETSQRLAAVAGQEAAIAMSADLTGKVPTPASLRALYREPAWEAVCPY